MTFQLFEIPAHRFFKLTAVFRNEEQCFSQGTNPRKTRTFGNNTSGELRLLAGNKPFWQGTSPRNMTIFSVTLTVCMTDWSKLVSHPIVYYPNAHDIADVPIKC